MPLRQKVFALLACFVIMALIIELVRKRRFKEQYSVLWLATSVIMLIFVVKYDWLVFLTQFIGAALPTSTLFFGALLFLMLLAVQFSLSLSKFSEQLKNLAQENALLRAEIERMQNMPRVSEISSSKEEHQSCCE